MLIESSFVMCPQNGREMKWPQYNSQDNTSSYKYLVERNI
jgi:hypothetical protein